MDQEEIFLHSELLLLKVNVITGWESPSGARLNILVDQFIKKLQEDYPQLNTDEIEYAFRSGGTAIEDWGKQMNLSLIDKVLVPYVNKRIAVSKTEEEKLLPPPQQIVYSEEQLFDFHRQDVENFYQRVRNGWIGAVPDYFAAILVKDGLLAEGHSVSNFFVQKLGTQAECIYKKQP